MSTLIVTAHPDPGSLTHRAAGRVRELVGPERTRTAHLAQEGFDPRFTSEDLAAYRGLGAPDHGVRAQQRRVHNAQVRRGQGDKCVRVRRDTRPQERVAKRRARNDPAEREGDEG